MENRPRPDAMDIHIERNADYDGLAGEVAAQLARAVVQHGGEGFAACPSQPTASQLRQD